MTSRTWVGGGTNNIYQGSNWSPGGLASGDTLMMTSGTANMAGGNLFGDTLYVGTQTSKSPSTPPAVVNLSNGASLTAVAATTSYAEQSITFNASGHDTLHLTINNNYTATMQTTVNIAANSVLQGTVTVGGHNGNLTINGGNFASFNNNGASSIGTNCVATINADVLGVGSFAVSNQAGLSFLHGVGRGQSVNLAGQDSLSIGDPHAFLGLVNVQNPTGQFSVALAGITHADSYGYAKDILTLFDHGRPIDTLRFHDTGAFQVTENASGVVIGSPTSTLPPNTVVLPPHGAMA